MENERTVQKGGWPEGWEETDCRLIRFTEQQLRWLYSLEWNRVQYDLLDTDLDQAKLKADWLDEWKENLFAALEHPQPDYLIDDEDLLYAEIRGEAEKEERPFWLYAFALELIRFAPYYSLDENGSLFWFVYADPNHAAVWRATDTRTVRIGWSGDAFSS